MVLEGFCIGRGREHNFRRQSAFGPPTVSGSPEHHFRRHFIIFDGMVVIFDGKVIMFVGHVLIFDGNFVIVDGLAARLPSTSRRLAAL